MGVVNGGILWGSRWQKRPTHISIKYLLFRMLVPPQSTVCAVGNHYWKTDIGMVSHDHFLWPSRPCLHTFWSNITTLFYIKKNVFIRYLIAFDWWQLLLKVCGSKWQMLSHLQSLLTRETLDDSHWLTDMTYSVQNILPMRTAPVLH